MAVDGRDRASSAASGRTAHASRGFQIIPHSQGAFIEKTIRSLLLQGYPKLEYINAEEIFDNCKHVRWSVTDKCTSTYWNVVAVNEVAIKLRRRIRF
jgi:hypothetical protein